MEGKMPSDLPREGASNSGLEPSESSDEPEYDRVSRKKMKKDLESMVKSVVEKYTMSESSIRKVVNEEIQSAPVTRGNGNRTHETTMSTESRTFHLKFLDEVSLPVLTGKEIEGKGGTAMRLAMVDNSTGQLVTSGPEASVKVEILLLQADDDDNDHNWSTEDFNNKIIRESDKEKPHVTEGKYARLKEGVAILSDVKLGHGSSWKKRCSCRLGARSVDNSNGSRVKEAWTESFTVEDRRGKLYGKRHPPFLSDAVWRLEKIGKVGERCKRLYKENVKTVRDFLFLLSADPQKLKRVFGASNDWNATVEHAQTCKIDDKKIYSYSSPGCDFAVAFDAVGQLKGIVRNSHYVNLDNNLSEVEQASARELLLLAFANREDITCVDDETSLVQQFPCESRGIGVATDSARNDEYVPIEPDTSSLAFADRGPSSSPIALGSSEALRDPSSTFPDQAPSSSLIAQHASCDPSPTLPDQAPGSSVIAQRASCDPSPTLPDQAPSSSLIAQHASCDPSPTLLDQAPGSSVIAQRASCDPSPTLPDQAPGSSVIAQRAFWDPSSTLPGQASSSSEIAPSPIHQYSYPLYSPHNHGDFNGYIFDQNTPPEIKTWFEVCRRDGSCGLFDTENDSIHVIMEGAGNSGSELPAGSSDIVEQLVLAVRKILKEKVEPMMDSIPKLVEEHKSAIAQLERRLQFVETWISTENKRMLEDPIPTPEPKNMELCFSNKISQSILMGAEIKAEDNTCIEVSLLDSSTGNIVDVGPIASASVEIVVLGQGTGDWTGEEFNEKIVRVEGKPPLLTVNECKLQGGKGVLKKVKLRHYASLLVKPSEFQLGARIVEKFDGITVKEATTESFVVKSYRNKYCLKKEIPCLGDNIWVLKNIVRRGKIHERLQTKGIDTVEKFLIQLMIDREELKNIVGPKWKDTVNHARKCESNRGCTATQILRKLRA